MTITKYTFFSPNGNDFPVTANADAKLYILLSGIDLTTFALNDWEKPKEVGLTKTYVNTSVIMAGRYFELKEELVQLNAATKNYIHVNIDLTNTINPVSLSVETADNSNTIDINNKSGVYKRVIEVIDTDAGNIVATTQNNQTHIFNAAQITKLTADVANLVDLEVSDNVVSPNLTVKNKATINNLTTQNTVQTKNLTVTEKGNIGGQLDAQNLYSRNATTTFSLIVKGKASERSNSFQTPTTYSTINGTALPKFTLYKSANVVTCNFAGSITQGSIPGGGAIVGWIQDNKFKPENTQNFTAFTSNGQRCRFTVDAGGAIRSHESLPKGIEIWDSMQWIVAGTEGGLTH